MEFNEELFEIITRDLRSKGAKKVVIMVEIDKFDNIDYSLIGTFSDNTTWEIKYIIDERVNSK